MCEVAADGSTKKSEEQNFDRIFRFPLGSNELDNLESSTVLACFRTQSRTEKQKEQRAKFRPNFPFSAWEQWIGQFGILYRAYVLANSAKNKKTKRAKSKISPVFSVSAWEQSIGLFGTLPWWGMLHRTIRNPRPSV